MARGPTFDTYDPAKIDAMREAQRPAARGDHKTAPGPQVEPCCECGDVIGPWWGENGETFCRRHAPHHLKHPGAAPDAP
ncbi:hypothetical protein [Bosea minatitlanensis]|uniref:Uncharacterized protein n=1 Tax=Bosea minatitlanensis TaxID=128782 RepID=A0ABW0EZY2_9HYPH|nr:hypothetical protein [Bosea minatitlanensis]MCT4492750.1 hypothetical protein [Bosea minatitlanensis]